MEFHVKNHYIKKFLGQYPQQNELKLLKYLTILGIHYLSSINEKSISFPELKKLASNFLLSHSKILEDISKSCPKPKTKINEELKVIKDEIARLNEKFEEKVK